MARCSPRLRSRGSTSNGHHPRPYESWPGLWNKQYKVRTCGDVFISLNRIRPRLRFGSLRRLCLELAPANVYMSALNWLMPERVADKRASAGAYPVGEEYVVDVD